MLFFLLRREGWRKACYYCCKSAGVGLGGGNGASKVGVGSRSGGSGEEYNEQAGGQVGKIEEGDRKGGKGADSSEDAGAMVGIGGKRIGHDGIDRSYVS